MKMARLCGRPHREALSPRPGSWWFPFQVWPPYQDQFSYLTVEMNVRYSGQHVHLRTHRTGRTAYVGVWPSTSRGHLDTELRHQPPFCSWEELIDASVPQTPGAALKRMGVGLVVFGSQFRALGPLSSHGMAKLYLQLTADTTAREDRCTSAA